MIITLPSNGKEIEIKKLKIFDLDPFVPKRIGPYTEKITIAGEEHEAEFDIRKFKEPPEKVILEEGEKLTQYSEQWWQQHEYDLYQAALLHETNKQDTIIEFYEQIKDFVLKNCVKKEDLDKIETAEDWKLIYDSVLVEQLTMEIIAETLDSVFQAEFQGEPVLDALKRSKKGHGSINTIKQWEISLMNKLGISELDYSVMDVRERSRRVCSEFLPEIMSYLETELQMSESKKSGKTKR